MFYCALFTIINREAFDTKTSITSTAILTQLAIVNRAVLPGLDLCDAFSTTVAEGSLCAGETRPAARDHGVHRRDGGRAVEVGLVCDYAGAVPALALHVAVAL